MCEFSCVCESSFEWISTSMTLTNSWIVVVVVFQLRLWNVTSVILVFGTCASQLKRPAQPMSNASAVSVKQVQCLCFPKEKNQHISSCIWDCNLAFVISAGFLDIKMKGCLAVSECNKTENVNFSHHNSTVYKMTKTCCNTDLCNSAPDRSHVSALVMMLAAAAAVKFIMWRQMHAHTHTRLLV